MAEGAEQQSSGLAIAQQPPRYYGLAADGLLAQARGLLSASDSA